MLVSRPTSDADMGILTGERPRLTAVQAVSALPVAAGLAAAAGLWRPDPGQAQLLRLTVLWSAALLATDAAIRIGRGLASGSDLVGRAFYDDEASLIVDPSPGLTEEDLAFTMTGTVDPTAGKPADFR